MAKEQFVWLPDGIERSKIKEPNPQKGVLLDHRQASLPVVQTLNRRLIRSRRLESRLFVRRQEVPSLMSGRPDLRASCCVCAVY